MKGAPREFTHRHFLWPTIETQEDQAPWPVYPGIVENHLFLAAAR